MKKSELKLRAKILLYGSLFGTILSVASCKEKGDNTKSDDYLYQYSIIDALLAGVYDGDLTFRELKKKGDFGIGTFNHLDGELLINNGIVYKIRYDGSVEIVPDQDTTSIAFVKKFVPDTVFMLDSPVRLDFEQLKRHIAERLDANQMFAIRLTGAFHQMKTRAPAPAEKPYPPLVEHLKGNQYEFDLQTTAGTAIGFYLPPYISGINVPGFHFHFIDHDQSEGGHILDFSVEDIKIEVDRASGLVVETIDSGDFEKANFETDREAELRSVESGGVK